MSARPGEVAWLLAAGVVVLAAIVMVAVGVLAARWWMRLLSRRLQRRDWDDLIARHRDLDRELTRIWRQR